MLNETVVTLQGWVGGDVQVRHAGEALVAHFRVACTPRRFRRSSQEWVDGDTQWYSVNAWRGLGDNCARSLRQGDPVVVHGKLSARTYVNNAGVEVTAFEVEASLVGHDLSRGTSHFSRTPKAAPAPATPDRESPDPESSEEQGSQEVATAA
ncbi:single-stranded DNA-binding protein [Nocardioides psychrotolerans]|uniref:single-stranded DNA-binding protein n=1 Tax=Nocardioides psychrotolerans TaxID=1005945 RepID=UPI003137BD1F